MIPGGWPLAWSALAPIANHLWQSTLVAGAAALLALALRRNRAHVRYGVWLAASVKFLVPFGALTAIGSRFAWRSSPTLLQPVATRVLSQPFSPLEPVLLTRAAAESFRTASLAPAVLAAFWALGAAALLLVWWARWRRIARIAREGSHVEEGREVAALRRLQARAGLTRPIALVSSPASLEPGIFGIVRPRLLWPQRMRDRLDDRQMEAILAHEICHVRRRDNLAAAMHMLVEAVFWFHPLVWWIGAQLVEERERACDEDVVSFGSAPELYAESILKTCEVCVESPLLCVPGVTGADLKARIERIMTNPTGRAMTPSAKLLLAAIATAVVAPIVAGAMAPPTGAAHTAVMAEGQFTTPRIHQPTNSENGPIMGTRALKAISWKAVVIAGAAAALGVPFETGTTVKPLHAQAEQTQAAPPLAFEAASVKPNKSGTLMVQIGADPSGRFTATNVPLALLLRQAYQLQPFQIIGAPGWADSDRFDIVAKADPATTRGAPPPGSGQPGPFQLMVRTLLAERFKLTVHNETRELPIYALVLARSDGRLGPQLKQSTTDCAALAAARRGGPGPGPGDGRGAGAGVLVQGGRGGPGPGAPPPPDGRGGPPNLPPDGRPQCGARMGPGQVSAGSQPLAQFGNILAQFVNRTVVDKTGLTGVFDIDLTWTPDPGAGLRGDPPPGFPPIDPNGPSIYTAVQEQLGLKLESQRGPVPVLVVDRVEHPTED